jgi:Putative addiction module component
MDITSIEHDALLLPVSERAKLAHKLLLNLENMSEIEGARLDEAERRTNEIDQGLVRLIPAEEVSQKAEDYLKY